MKPPKGLAIASGKDTDFEHCKPASMDYGAKLRKDDGDSLPDSSDYRKIIGKLLYLSNTRPDISFAVGKLSQFLDCPTTNHLKAAHRILMYIKNSSAAGLFFLANFDRSLIGFFDSAWAGCLDS
ncbi:uncharacterized protein LOC107609508 [Arachis ipaensis]|uniref:uncharacterized protein LOC107609508 n=1 Tax=Arachis ipaensis TaxID=130454 RepID=UPI0007AF79AE|nr:uncharacterized protein LOC107609508 [Arachis ipaensis]XP_025628443.1 uncharacterized protein LOC112721610 [Arachis hypogaea]